VPRKPVARGTRGARLRVTLRSTGPNSTFHCRLDRRKRGSCKPRLAFLVKPGRHTIRGRAVGIATLPGAARAAV